MSGIGSPYENMAIDEALFDAACASGVPALRFYGWTPPTASLGFAQRASEALDFAEMDRRHVAWVRRPTGGRTVLHDMEVTYSVSIPQSDPLYTLGLETSYKWICGPIIAGLLSVGVSAALAPHGSTGFMSASCFTAPGTTDIIAGHRKIVGSAQMRTRDGFLQHGSVILKTDLEKLFAVVRTCQSDAQEVSLRAARLMTSVSDETHRAVSFREMASALAAAFSTAEGIRLVPDSLTARETASSLDIVARKYGREDWNALR
jgi:lipoate-protein ligase A